MSDATLRGQWLGYSDGYPFGKMVMDIEIVDGQEVANAYLFPTDPNVTATFVEFRLPEVLSKSRVVRPIFPFDARRGIVLSREQMSREFPDVQHSDRATIACKRIDDDTLEITWSTELVTSGAGRLKRTVIPDFSAVEPEGGILSWEEFKQAVTRFQFDTFMFRGQKRDYPLQTSFHRTERKILSRYLKRDVQDLHRSLVAHLDHLFDLQKPEEFGAFLNLAQHHVYPTPLLDWTLSPFVAAWFAFKDKTVERENDSVRVFGLNKPEFEKLPQFQTLTFAPPHFSLLKALALDNPRAIPQQAVLSLTNLQNIEGYLMDLERANSTQYLYAWDIKGTCKDRAMNELAMMGITQSTMFPSVESTCLDLRARYF